MFVEKIVSYLVKETIKNKKLIPNKIKVELSDNKKKKDVSIKIQNDDQLFGNKFHYGKLGYDKYILTTRLRKLHILKRNISYHEE